jgi:hypothetical protein
MQYIHCLVKNANTPMECLDIERACSDAVPQDVKIVDSEEALNADLHVGAFNLTALEDADIETIRKAKSKLETKRESESDPSRQAEYDEKIHALEEYLGKNLDIHGKGRPVGEMEKARKRVSNAINRAKKNICEEDKTEGNVVGRHFENAVKATGTGFVYEPDQEIDWTLS